MVLPPNPPIKRRQCEHDGIIKFNKLSKMAVEYICGSCGEPLGIIIDPDTRRINAYAAMKQYDVGGGRPTKKPRIVTGEPRKLTYSERQELK